MHILKAAVVDAAASVLLALLLLSCAYARAADAAPQPFDIGPQALAAALSEFARQSHEEILFAPEVVAKKGSSGVRGTMEPLAALKILLKDSGLAFSTTPGGAILVGSGSASASSTAPQTTTSQSQDPPPGSSLQLAQATPGQTPGDVSVEKQDERSSEKKKGEQLQEVVVTGSRIPLSAGQQSVQPVRSYTREDIANSGQVTMGDFLNTLPDVSNSLGSGIAGVQSVQLHGLPVGTTLTLLDGRRMEISSLGFFDINSIPPSAVERVEILPVGASAVYGADALGGAINFILRKDFTGLEVNATLDHAPEVNDPGINLAWGKAWEQGSVSLIAAYDRRGELLGSQREPISGQIPSYVTATQASALVADVCAPGNVYSVDGVSNLPGLSSPYAAIPAGITGKPTIAQFANTAGTLNSCNAGRFTDITPREQRESALLSAHYELSASADLFTEILLSHRHEQFLQGPQLQVISFLGGTVAADNPYNPFGEAVNVSFAYPGAGPQLVENADLIRPLIGVRGALFADWHYEATATLSKDHLGYGYTEPDPTLIAAALASSDPATALNPFASGSPGSAQLLNSFATPGVDTLNQVYTDRLVTAEITLRGATFQLPAGAVQAVIGGDWGQEKHETEFLVSSANPFGIPSSDILLSRRTFSAFGEARAPLLAAEKNAPGSERLTLTLASRYDHSDDFGGKTTWQGGLQWRAVDTLTFNASYGTSYRAPRLDEIAGPQTTSIFPLGIADPFRGNQLEDYSINFVSGPNHNLKPETGSSSTFGVQYSSEAIQGLRASLTWYDLKISNYIGVQNPEVVIDNPDLFPGAVIRAPPTAQDQQQGFLGVITQFNNADYNYGDLHVTGVDADLAYAIDTRIGQLTPSVAMASIYRWQSALLPGLPAIDSVSKATLTGVGWAPRWKGTASLAWKRDTYSMDVSARYIGPYLDYQDFTPNTHEIGNTWIADASARVDVGRAMAAMTPWAEHAYLSIAVVNLFNKVPPFSYNSAWYDASEYDVRGRYLRLSVGVRM